ncbi:hypothetical protein C8R47DRAFT_1223957 [Mycena vitilis]|nr:hypothetical protein C8R47DRAFT_1223957 [Mycena vitilis]
MAELRFHIVAREDSEPLMQGPRARDRAQGMAPPQPSNKKFGVRERWFSKLDIFQKDHLIIPVFWKPLKHWVLVVVFFADTKIRVYDSLRQPKGTRAKAIHGRVMDMLMHEHRVLYSIPLPPAWAADPVAEAAPLVPQQDNAFDCAIFMIAFAESTAEGRSIEAPDFRYTPQNAAEDRIRIANRLLRTPLLYPPTQSTLVRHLMPVSSLVSNSLRCPKKKLL